MEQLTRIIVRFAGPQMAFLRQEAGRLGLPVAEVLRRFVDQVRERRLAEHNRERPANGQQAPRP